VIHSWIHPLSASPSFIVIFFLLPHYVSFSPPQMGLLASMKNQETAILSSYQLLRRFIDLNSKKKANSILQSFQDSISSTFYPPVFCMKVCSKPKRNFKNDLGLISPTFRRTFYAGRSKKRKKRLSTWWYNLRFLDLHL